MLRERVKSEIVDPGQFQSEKKNTFSLRLLKFIFKVHDEEPVLKKKRKSIDQKIAENSKNQLNLVSHVKSNCKTRQNSKQKEETKEMQRLRKQIKSLKKKLIEYQDEDSDYADHSEEDDYEDPNRYTLDFLQVLTTPGGAVKYVSPKTLR